MLTGPYFPISILGRLVFHVIDHKDEIRLLFNFELQSQPLNAFKQAQCAIGVGSGSSACCCSTSSARGLSALATVEVAAWRPGEREVESSFKPRCIDGGMIDIGGRHCGQ